MVREDGRQLGIETGEALIRAVSPAWLGGFFSPGGSLHFAVDPKGYAYPRASVGDNNWDKLVALTKMLGGGVSRVTYHKRGEVNNVWTLSKSGLAVCLAEQMQPYAPSWQETILAFLNWENTGDPEDRVAIARELQESAPAELTKVTYSHLVVNYDFLAGVLDNRGAIVTRKKPYNDGFYDTSSLEVNSQNHSLLEALQESYGGYFGQASGAESYDWRLGWKKYTPLLENLKGHLKLLQF